MSDTEAQAPLDDAPPVEEPQSGTPKTDTKATDSQPAGAKEERGPSPWAKDLADRGLDDPQFDEYLNEVWQPRMTQYEQQASEWSGLFGGDMERAQIMAGLAEALESDPEGTYQQIGEILGLTNTDGEYSDTEGLDDGVDGTEEHPDEYRDWVMNKMQEEQIQQQDAAYESLLSELSGQVPGFDANLFHAAIVAHEGDPEAAMQWYMQYHRAPEPGETPDGPTPVGEGNPTPPEEKQYSGIGDAIADFMSESKTSKSAR
jgi:hypothetical protein